MPSERCNRNHALVTGSNSGIGRATVHALVAKGWHVFAGLHHADDAGKAYDEQHVTALAVDVTDEDHLVAAVGTVSEHVGRHGLDALVNNAGVGVAGPLELIGLDRLRSQLEINVIGQVAVTQNFLPLLRAATGRIVFISSIGDRVSMPFAGPLTGSKAALSMIAHSWRQELAPWGIQVSIVAPALIHTEAADKLQRDADALTASFGDRGRRLYGRTFTEMIKRAVAQEKGGSSPSAVADAVVKLVSARRPAPRQVVGKGGSALSVIAQLPIPVVDSLRRRMFALPAPGSARTDEVQQSGALVDESETSRQAG